MQDDAVNTRLRYLWSLPWVLAVIGLAVPMVGSGFIDWPFVVGWLILLLLAWRTRPLGGASQTARLGTGVLVIGLLALLATLGGVYLVPAVAVWMLLVAAEPRPDTVGDGVGG